jgi:uncharacterized protein YqgQ
MTLAELEYAEKRVQQQWHDLVMAEQEGASLQELEQMYDSYILFLEEYNRCSEAYQRESRTRRSPASRQKRITKPISSHTDDEHVKLAS